MAAVVETWPLDRTPMPDDLLTQLSFQSREQIAIEVTAWKNDLTPMYFKRELPRLRKRVERHHLLYDLTRLRNSSLNRAHTVHGRIETFYDRIRNAAYLLHKIGVPPKNPVRLTLD